ncbi:MAG: efflux RND transporter periplasmic adaptor subunit [Bacteroidetes bacterium]|nr:efflux RND transporter periplasmic adaptor subunit [Bacteroidota bacterium]
MRTITTLLALVLLVAFVSCKSEKQKEDGLAPDEYYTCSMDPQVTEYHAGRCPICHMEMIKVKKHQLKAGEIRLSTQQQQLANIKLETIGLQPTATELTLEGTVTIDQERASAISSRVAGRITRLAVRSGAEPVARGAVLYSIYSEELNAAQAEYLAASRRSASGDVAAAAKQRLRLYGMSDEMIAEIARSGKIMNEVPFTATSSGYVTGATVSEGDYVSEGSTLFELADLGSLWVEAQVPVAFLTGLHEGDEATFTIPGSQLPEQRGSVIFIQPHLQQNEHYVSVRFRLDHPPTDLRPGMLANISLRKEPHIALTLPHGAVEQDSHGASVWVLRSDGVFEIKMVTLGIENPNGVEITSGLSDGDKVVISGAYLLTSEYTFKNGASPMAGMQM